MKIADIRTHFLEHRLETAFESASMRFDRRLHLLVEVICDDGTVGWGECLGPPLPNAAVVEAYRDLLLGSDPLETERAWALCYNALRDQGQRGLTITALSGIDIALWDIKGKHFGVPVSTLLGGRFRDRVEAYATGSFRRDGVDRVRDNEAEMAGHAAAGFRRMKLKIGFDLAEDLRVIAAVREAIGPDRMLMIDANHGYTVGEAIRLGQQAERYDIDWFEEPVVPEQLDAYLAVKAQQPIPLAAGETWHTRWGFHAPMQRRCVEIVQPDLCGMGGFTEARRVADMASLYGIRVVPHIWGTAVQLAAALQFMAAMVPDPMRRASVAPIMEFDRTENPFRQAVVTQSIEHENGWVRVPDGPGLGIEIDRAALSAFAPKMTI
ncbi:mandelate racemase [Thioclava dalianensis]|uniref:Mandelate racemase n=2 Tax=Thioclava dalianensis TaxID=1185766 RepID=A0A074TB27_9RHOB|nr:mandelate racemase/muconate lactonizing enzyme family protein [Thioclava dalianensis]KEP68991.1 mandelate racemase [Thioclava dalianensis]SFN72974.1 D-galactarolactone cycloisomerase [Thioclava dalianensis]